MPLSIKDFWRNYNIKDAIYNIRSAWNNHSVKFENWMEQTEHLNVNEIVELSNDLNS